ncbi:hypothetical protein PMIN04_003000 [Paraphaeosphaeria minitans]
MGHRYRQPVRQAEHHKESPGCLVPFRCVQPSSVRNLLLQPSFVKHGSMAYAWIAGKLCGQCKRCLSIVSRSAWRWGWSCHNSSFSPSARYKSALVSR